MLATAFLALVIAVHDGDTLRVQVDGQPSQSVRVAYIDAPELGQPWGRASGKSLRKLCLHTWAWVQPQTTDRYRRTVATVQCRAKDASHHQVERGMAWVYKKYTPAKSPLYAAQLAAQQARRGLWVQPAQDPAEWRKSAQSQKH